MSSLPDLGLIDRPTLASRWQCSIMSLKRMQRAGRLEPVNLGKRLIRYRMADIARIESATAGLQQFTTPYDATAHSPQPSS